jgi:hypothetical protein
MLTYSTTFQNITISAQQDLFEISPADDMPCVALGFWFSQGSDAGDAEEEFLRIACIRGHTTSGSGGS